MSVSTLNEIAGSLNPDSHKAGSDSHGSSFKIPTNEISGNFPQRRRELAKIFLRNISYPDFLKRVERLTHALQLPPIVAKVLVARGIWKQEEALKFVAPTLRDHLPDPMLIKNVEDAVRLLITAIEQGRTITVYSDFDVDGLSGASQLVLYLHALGARVNHYVPNRFHEGYGLVKAAVEKLARAGTEVLVTVDCGVTNHQELALAKRLGMKTIVIDHHQVQQLPPADVVVDPAQEGCPFREYQLCAAGLVWMFLIVLRQKVLSEWATKIERDGLVVPNPKDFLDLAALGTICDMVPLVSLNRMLAQRGIEALQQTTRPGLVALKEVAGIGGSRRLTSGHVGFGLGPRINAGGRLGDAKQVFELLTSIDPARAKILADNVNRLNTQRRDIEERVRKACLRSLEEDPAASQQPALVVYGDDYHIGVIGIVAQRLVEQFHRPTVVLAPAEEVVGDKIVPVIKGSVRSIKGFHVAEALQSVGHLLLKHGGHAQAGGLTLVPENHLQFKEAFIARAASILHPEMLRRHLVADLLLDLSELSYDFVNELSKLSPFGVGNPSPLFVSLGVTIHSVSSMNGNHLRLRVSNGGIPVTALAWNAHGHQLLKKGNTVNIVYHPTLNTYQGVASVQLSIKEVWEDTDDVLCLGELPNHSFLQDE